jgi:predicted phage terminase large subunit-like protein
MNAINQMRLTRHLCESSLIDFARYLFRNRDGRKLIVRPLHRLICQVLERVYAGDIRRLLINIPPGYTKTELVVKAFIAWGFAKNPRSKYMHLSYSDSLASDNSASIKETIESDYFQSLWPMRLKHDSQSKHRWNNQYGGGVYAAATGAAVTGFRAGRDLNSSEFSGALVIDDPLKPEDAYSIRKRSAINNRFTNTVRSRLVNESVPIVVIMQRLHVDDLSGVLLKGGSGDTWHHLLVPAELTDIDNEYPPEYTHGLPVQCDLAPGPVWPEKHTTEQLLSLAQADKYTFSAQYMQRPIVPGGSLFNVGSFGYYKSYDAATGNVTYQSGAIEHIKSLHLFCDTAHKTGQHNDYSVFALWGLGADSRIYLIDLLRAKLEAPDLKRSFVAMCHKWAFRPGSNTVGLREAYIEDKASGIGLIQEMSREAHVKIVPIQRTVDKVSRAYSSAPAVDGGRLVLPMGAPFVRAFVQEHEDFSPVMAHRFDDQCDTTMDAIQRLLYARSTAICYKDMVK